jgi:septal ring factor EnvC (AmiA/AmiB activator)
MKKDSQLLVRIGKAMGMQAGDVTESEVYKALQAEFDSYKETAEQLTSVLQAENTELKEALAETLEQVESLKSTVESLKSFAEGLEAAKAEAAKKAEELRMAARKEKLEAVAGSVKADALMAVAGNLDDAAFEAVVEALATSLATEANSAMFRESGVTGGEVDPSRAPTPESAEMQILREKYKDFGAAKR